MKHLNILQQLLPSGSYDSNAPNLLVDLVAESNALDAAVQSADWLLAEMQPGTASLSLYDWERNYGLPDHCVSTAQTIDQRRAALESKVFGIGGQSIAYFESLATAMGYPGTTITEFSPASCNSDCNSAIYSDAALFVWQVNVPLQVGVFYASCNSDCNSALQSWGDGAFECRFKQLKPSHTTVIFSYL